ncbi:MAG TPA: ABC transporter substrate-binding protein [Terracidiphilus sp.]|nr:ABC transporter substrate-binding protein [Terracidiphilus sp.]
MLRRCVISCALLMLVLPAAARTRPHYGGTLRVEIAGDPWQRPDGLARRLVFDGLTAIGTDGAVKPALAVEWSADDDDHRWQFRLRPGVHFQDGTPLTSVNAAAALNAACPSNCPWTAVRAVGSAVVFVGDAPMPALPALLADDAFRLALTINAEGKTPEGSVGTGPFQVAGFNNSVLTLTANENCWQGRPFVDSVELRVHRAVRDQWLDLSVGRADMVEVSAEMTRQAQQQRLNVIAQPDATLLALQVNDSGPLANPILRTALAEAIDRSALANVIFQKQGEPVAGLLPQRVSGYAFLFPVERDLNRAHELRGGLSLPPLTMSAESGDAAMQLAAQRIALDLHEAGFTVQMVAGNELRTNLTLRRFMLEGGAPGAMLETVLRAANEQPAVIGDGPADLYQAEHEALERHTLIPLLDLPRAYAVGARVRDLRLNADGEPDIANASLEDAP